ncbi:START domain-containing protein 10 [Schistosoma japonicum]|nr:START domain-containing protein 10 [Schistosoma japonicum]
MEIFRLGEVGPPKNDDFQRFKNFAKDENHWKRRHKRKNVEVFTRSSRHTNMKMIKVVAIFPDVSSHVIYDMLHDNYYRSSWDNTMRESTEICRDIPSWAINLATTKVAPRLVKSLHRAALRYPGWKAQNRPEFKPWRNPEQQNKSIPALCPTDILREPDFPLNKVHEKHVSKEKALKEVGLPPDTQFDEDSA